MSVHCKLDLTISKAALQAVPSKRTILLALPNIKLCDFGRIYYQVSPAALKYEATERILQLSKPRLYLPEECKPSKLSLCEKRVLDEERLRKLALAKKLIDCPQQLTKEEMEELFTPHDHTLDELSSFAVVQDDKGEEGPVGENLEEIVDQQERGER
ncbi:uncharacterized protein LOC116414678 [Apis florea]|uniref:uncharacterized protein LOC116414678 n=1 Tax=Apis florea TaxID=7463 RepID=UPI0012FED61C|nr:uncharacterized protein LOC116414678 [Apis florea]